jgi:hypothetical protein
MFNKKLKLNFLTKKVSIKNNETAASDSGDELKDDTLHGKPTKPKAKITKLAVIAIPVAFVSSAIAAYLYLGGLFNEPLKPAEIPAAQTLPPLDVQQKSNQPNQVAAPPVLPENRVVQPNQSPATVAMGQPAPMPTPRQQYIPARDILRGTVDLQSAKERIEKLELELKAKELEKKLMQIGSELYLLPVQTEALKVETATRIAEKNVRPFHVESPNIASPPPSLVFTSGSTAVIQMPTGEQARVEVGDIVGDYKVFSIRGRSITLVDRQGKHIELSMSLPEKYPVHPSMFGNRPAGTVITAPPTQQPGQGNVPPFMQQPQPQFVPVPGLGGR